jgi:hypothetical protein
MKKFFFALCALVLIAAAGQVQVAHAAQHQATFVINVATVPDTMPSIGTRVCMRGDYVSGSWPNDSTSTMTHVGGDYWSKTVMLDEGFTTHYKYSIEYPGASGWEQNLATGSTNREFTMGTQDTVLQVEFWNNGPGTNGQYWRPWTSAGPDTEMIYFRVNMGGPITTGTFAFDNNVDQVGVRGGGPAGSDLNWAPTFYLHKESPPSNSAGAFLVPASWFWSGGLKFPKTGMTAGNSIGYKFIIGADWGRDELQGGAPNRSFNTPSGLQDTTLQWVFYNNQHPSGRQNIDTVVVTYHVDVAKAVATGGFAIGDTLYARSGYFGTGQVLGKLVQLENLIGTIYEGTDTVITAVGQTFDYQYYHVKNAAEVRENYYNFYYSGDQTSEAERRQLVVPSHSFTINDVETSITQARRQPDFPNARVLNHGVTVKYELNLKPAYFQVMAGDTLHDIQGSFDIFSDVIDSISTWGVFMNGPALGGWNNPGGTDWDFGLNTNPDKRMWDDGTHGDAVAGDSIYTVTTFCSPDSILIGTKGAIGQTFKFGVRGGDNEGGKGGYGNNHTENISDLASTFTLHSQFGNINPAFYSAWDYDKEQPANITAVKDKPGIPKVFALGQNYPNPFNPSTRIDYSIPATSVVTLKIFNVLGQEVATVVNTRQDAGQYHVGFNASKLTSGVYFYRLNAGSFVSSKRMLLVK